MSYTRKLTTFEKGNQLSNCEKYNLQDLSDMFSQSEIDGTEEYTELEDILIESNNGKDESHFDLNMSVTIMEQLDDEEMNMFIIKSEHEDTNNKVECSASLDNEFANESI